MPIVSCVTEGIYWPMFLVATAAAVVASQATISATFSIIKQALSHGCFPRVKVVHTSKTFLGQIYVPDINWILMVLCIAVTAGFRKQSQIGNAYGKYVNINVVKFMKSVFFLSEFTNRFLIQHAHTYFKLSSIMKAYVVLK